MNRIVGVVSLVLAATVLGVWPARAHEEPLIQPGAPVYGRGGALSQFGPCTLNFVFRDARHTYIGASARCLRQVGERAVTAGREFGTVVFFVADYPVEPGSNPLVDSVMHSASGDEFALVRVDDSEVHRVTPVVLDLNWSPHGVAKGDEIAPGQPLFLTGQATGGQWPARHRPGVLLSDDERGFTAAFPAGLGDGGAPVLDTTNWHAVGVVASALSTGGAYGTTMERILQLLDEAGFDVELVTAYDEEVRGGD